MKTQNTKFGNWQEWLGWSAAICMALLWLSAGFWKLTDISNWQLKLTQLLVPVQWSLPGTLAVAITEVVAGVLLLRPLWRRWGGMLSALLLLVFMAYMGINYQTLQGEDCSCFPWLERAVGPAFFWSDTAMLAVSLVAMIFSSKPADLRRAMIVVLVVLAFAGLMLGLDSLDSGAVVALPEMITADEQPYALQEGKVFLFFFNPSCMHCLDAGQTMSGYQWQAQIIGIPTQDMDWGPGFLEDAGLRGVKLSPDLKVLKETFPFEDVPYGALLKNGTVLERVMFWEEPDLSETLRGQGFID